MANKGEIKGTCSKRKGKREKGSIQARPAKNRGLKVVLQALLGNALGLGVVYRPSKRGQEKKEKKEGGEQRRAQRDCKKLEIQKSGMPGG